MPPRPYAPPPFAAQPFRGADAIASGQLTPNLLRSRSLRRVLHGVYVAATVPDTPAVRLAAARLVVPSGLVISGATAAWIHGVRVGIEPWPMEVTGTTNVRFSGPEGIRRRHARLDADDIVAIDGGIVTSAMRTAFDLSRHYDVLRGTAAVDAFLNRGLISPDGFVGYVENRGGWTGVPNAREVCTLMDGGAESVQETRLRLTFVWGGLPRPETQVVVLDEFGHVVARIDLAYRAQRVGSEYDGAQHFESGPAIVRDLSRHNDLLGYAWTIFRFTNRDLRTPMTTVRRVGAALGLDPRPTRSFARLAC